jgi:zinc transport system permease protein
MPLDFIGRALVAGIGVALAAGPLGSIMVWRRMSNFGDALAHATLLGLCISLLLDMNLYVGLSSMSLLIAYGLALLSKRSALGQDAILSVLAYASLSMGLILATTLQGIRVDLLGYLYGDILAVNQADLLWIYGVVLVTMLVLGRIWRPMLSMTVHEDLARVEGVSVGTIHLLLVVLMAIFFAVAMKLVGILLITGLLIIPASAARSFARTPEQMAMLASFFGIVSVCVGILASTTMDWPTGPAIVVVATLIFLLSHFARRAN